MSALLSLVLTALLLTAAPAPCAAEKGAAEKGAAAVTGHWRGEIALPGSPIPFHLDLIAEDGPLAGTFSAPSRDLEGIPLEEISFDGERLSFDLQATDSIQGVHLEGRVDGETFEGTYFQGQGQVPFAVERGEDPVERCRLALDAVMAGDAPWLEAAGVGAVAAGVVCHGEVAAVRALGARSSESVTADTAFPLGPVSEVFTSFLVAALHDEGELSLDMDLGEVHPPLLLAHAGGPLVGVTVTDVLAHRTGLAAFDLGWRTARDLGEARLLEIAGALPSAAPPRTRMLENAVLYAVLALAVERRLESPWSELLASRIFDPLGMEHTTAAEDDLVAPARGMKSSARDLALFARMLLGEGRFSRYILMFPPTVGQTFTIHTPPSSAGAPSGFGLGWHLDAAGGELRARRGGESAEILLLPEHELAVVTLAEGGVADLPRLLADHLAGRVLASSDDATPELAGVLAEKRRAAPEETSPDAAASSQPPARGKAAYVASFHHPGFGDLLVHPRDEGEGLAVTLNDEEAPLHHRRHDVFVAAGDGPLAGLPLHFLFDAEATLVAVASPLDPELAPIRFARTIPEAFRDPAILEPLVGVYRADGGAVSINAEGGVLRLAAAGRPLQALEPTYAEDVFAVAGEPNTRVVFRRGFVDGKGFGVTGLAIETARGASHYERIY